MSSAGVEESGLSALKSITSALTKPVASHFHVYQTGQGQMQALGIERLWSFEMVNVGMVGYRFNTVGVSDAISMGTDGMSFSLQSRDLIADSVGDSHGSTGVANTTPACTFF